jgi:hypothetical protein
VKGAGLWVSPSILCRWSPCAHAQERAAGARRRAPCAGAVGGGHARSGPGPRGRAVVRLVRGRESRAADAAEGAVRVDAARVHAERGGRLRLVTLVDVWGGGWRIAA